MEEKNIQTVKTTRGELKYYRDWGNYEGGIVMLNPQTVNRYREIKEEHPDSDKCGVFFAFSNEQFSEGYKRLVRLGHIKDGDKVMRSVGGSFGTKEGLDKFFNFYENRDKVSIHDECDPQEVYFYEYNNYESMIAMDGDLEAIKIIISIWGADVARNIKRFSVCRSVDDIICKPIRIEGLYFTYNGEKKQPSSVWFSNMESEATGKGKCHTMYGGMLHPVLAPDGESYYNESLAGLCAKYDGNTIYGFYKE